MIARKTNCLENDGVSHLSAVHVPERTCVGCRSRKPKAELVRLAVAEDGRVVPDKAKVMAGRGVYICRSRECLLRALKSKGFTRHFRRPVRTDFLENLKSFPED